MSDLISRKFAAINEAIEGHGYRAALQLLAKRDIEKLPLAKALKAFCLAKMGAEAEALELCDDVMRGNPSDEDVCAKLSSVLHMCGETRRAVKMFETALAHNPTSQSLQRDLFFCHVLQGDYKQQQLTAMKLCKESGNQEFMFWAAVAMNFQVPQDAMGPAPVLNIAEMMMKKAVDAGVHHSEALSLLFHTMARQGKMEEALAAFRGGYHFVMTSEAEASIAAADDAIPPNSPEEMDHNRKKTPNLLQFGDAVRLEIHLTIQAKLWPEVCDLFVKALTEVDGEDWSFYIGFVASALLSGISVELDDLDVEPRTTSAVSSVSDVRALLRHFQRVECTKRPPSIVRGAFLAEMLLDCALLQRRYGNSGDAVVPESDQLLSALVSRLMEYIGRIGNSACAFYDVQRMLSPFVLPACWSLAAVSCGGHTSPAFADTDSVAVLLTFGLPYPAVDTFNAPLPHKATVPTFTFRAGEDTRSRLYAYLCSLSSEDKRPPADIKERVGLGEDAITEDQQKALAAIRDSFQLYTTAHQIRRYLGLHQSLSAEEQLALARVLVADWQRSLPARTGCERNISVLPGDDNLLLGLHVLRDICAVQLQSVDASTPSPSWAQLAPFWQTIMETLTLVDAGLKESPYNSQFFLVQLQLYSWIGAIIPATDAYNGLRPKHMQQDTLAHRIVPVLVHGGGHFIAKQFAEDTYRFHRNSIGDIADNTRTAFTRSSYSKIFEFKRFDDKLHKSLQLAEMKGLSAHLNLPFRQFSELQFYLRKLVTGEIPLASVDFSESDLAALVDLSDFDAAFVFDPPANELGKVDFRQRCVARIKLRQQYMKMLYWAAEGNSDSLRDAIAVLSLQLSNCGLLAVSDAASTASTGRFSCSLLPWQVSLGLLEARSSFVSDVWTAVLASFDACRGFFQAVSASAAAGVAAWTQVSSLFANLSSKVSALLSALCEDPFTNAPVTLLTSKSSIELLVSPVFLAEASLFITELLSVVALVVFTCCKSMPKRKAAKGGKGKAAVVDPLDAAMEAGFTALKDTVLVVSKGTANFNAILNVREKFKSPAHPPSLSAYASSVYNPACAVTAFAQSADGVGTAAGVFVKLSASQSESLSQLQALLQDRVAMAKAAKV